MTIDYYLRKYAYYIYADSIILFIWEAIILCMISISCGWYPNSFHARESVNTSRTCSFINTLLIIDRVLRGTEYLEKRIFLSGSFVMFFFDFYCLLLSILILTAAYFSLCSQPLWYCCIYFEIFGISNKTQFVLTHEIFWCIIYNNIHNVLEAHCIMKLKHSNE